jgi:hypothetical protein
MLSKDRDHPYSTKSMLMHMCMAKFLPKLPLNNTFFLFFSLICNAIIYLFPIMPPPPRSSPNYHFFLIFLAFRLEISIYFLLLFFLLHFIFYVALFFAFPPFTIILFLCAFLFLFFSFFSPLGLLSF